MIELAWPPKDPDDSLDYSIDWSKALPQGSTISGAAWSVNKPGLTLSNQTVGQKTTTVWLAGGRAGVTYVVTCEISTSSGHVYQRSVRLPVIRL